MGDTLRLMRRALGDDRGATAIEYALLAGLIAAGLIVLVGTLGDSIAGGFAAFNAAMDAAR